MLITKEFKSQNTPLSPSELMATYKILQALKIKIKIKIKIKTWIKTPKIGLHFIIVDQKVEHLNLINTFNS